MSFPLSDVPKVLTCPDCGTYIKDLTPSEAFEFITAWALKARVASRRMKGFDVYASDLYPDLTFQVKCSSVRRRKTTVSIIDGRRCEFHQNGTWSWSENVAGSADWYVFFGIAESVVTAFAVPRLVWLDESTTGKGRILTITAQEYSKCGRYERASKRNKFWEYSLNSWPSDLYATIDYWQMHGIHEQLELIRT